MKEVGHMPYAIEIKDLETVAFLRALLHGPTHSILHYQLTESGKLKINKNFPGGLREARQMNWYDYDMGHVRDQLRDILKDNNITPTQAPWLNPSAPTEIGQYSVEYTSESVTVGCQQVSLADLKLMVEKCEGYKE
jgi:hypothetical protein